MKKTYNYLVEWGNREALCLAGLYHAAYSTDGYTQQLMDLSDRGKITSLIGIEAENIVYYYAACDRDYFYDKIGRSEVLLYRNRFTYKESFLKLQLFCDLLELTFANEIDIVSNNQDFKEIYRDWYTELFDRFEPYVSNKAFQSYLDVFAY